MQSQQGAVQAQPVDDRQQAGQRQHEAEHAELGWRHHRGVDRQQQECADARQEVAERVEQRAAQQRADVHAEGASSSCRRGMAAATAWPRCEIRSFSSSGSSAVVRPDGSRKIGS